MPPTNCSSTATGKQPQLVGNNGNLGMGSSSNESNHATAERNVCVGSYFRRKPAVDPDRGTPVIYKWPCIGCRDCGFRGHPYYATGSRTNRLASRRTTHPASPDESAAPPVPLRNQAIGTWWNPILIDTAKKLDF